MKKQTGNGFQVSGVRFQAAGLPRRSVPAEAGGKWPLSTFRSSILSLLLAAGMMLAMAQRASADWTGATSGSGYVDGGDKDYLHTGNWSGGTINDRFNVGNLTVYLDGDRTGAPVKTAGAGTFYIETADSTPRTLYLSGTIQSASGALCLGASTSTKLIVDLNGADRQFSCNNGQSGYIYAKVTGSGRLTLAPTRGNGINLYNPDNDWTGGLTIGGAYATVNCQAANVIPFGPGKGSLYISDVEADENLQLNGFSQTVNDLSSATANSDNRRIRTSGSPTLTVLSYNNSTYSGIIQDGISLTKSGAAQLTLAGTTANTHGGVTTVNEGTLALQKTAGVNAIAAALTIGNGSGTDTVKLLAAHQIANTVDVTFTAGGTPTLDLNGNSETVDAIIASGAGAVIDGTSGTPTLGVGANNHASATFAGVIKNTAGSLALTKSGSGVQILSNVNTYVGDTTVSGGTLRLGAIASIVSTNIFVGASATLQLDNSTSLPDAAKLDLNNTGIVNLNFGTGKEQIDALWINGSQMPNGTYSAFSHPANFTGSGFLRVGPPSGTMFLIM
jgi:autotransporter-associated beta strand protein